MSEKSTTKQEICVPCKGSGREEYLAGDTCACKSCKGSGYVYVTTTISHWR